ncbi:putative cyclin domain-containing protein [Helianthus annuus]|nr:putative cyclin domain-containing protein [Helianthus annuus]
MKKLRSNLPRRKRTNCSPILKSPIARKFNSSSIIDSASNFTRDVAFSTDSISTVSTNNKSTKKRSFADGNGEFRRITRSYSKRMEIMAEKKKTVELELSEASSCVELLNSSSKNVIRKGSVVFKAEAENNVYEIENSEVTTRSECSVFPKLLTDGSGRDNLQVNEENDVVSVLRENTVCEIENSEVTTRSECSVFPKLLTDGSGRDNLQVNEENDVVSVSSRRVSPKPKSESTSRFKLSDATINEGESVASGFEITSYVNNSVTDGTVNDDEVENCGESKLISSEFDLKCSEHLSSRYEECDYSSAMYTDANTESCEFEISSDFDTSTWYDSGSQFSERSFGDTTPSPTFQLFLVYRQKFCKSEFSSKVVSEQKDNQPSNRIVKLLRPEDEVHEESYQMMKKRERRQVYLHDYAAEYSGMKEYGDLVVLQRSKMVHWIMKHSAYKELQEETMFLGVSFLDRFLTKGYFRNKRDLEIAGIACLTLATRIEENQPYNSIRQKIFNVGSNEYSRSEVVAMEWLVQDVLNFQCYLPTIYNFLWFYLKAARAGQGVAKAAKRLAAHALLGHEQLSYWPSTVAASLVCLACLTVNKQSSHQQITRIRNGSNDKDLPDCIKSMECLVQSIR